MTRSAGLWRVCSGIYRDGATGNGTRRKRWSTQHEFGSRSGRSGSRRERAIPENNDWGRCSVTIDECFVLLIVRMSPQISF